MVPTYNHWNIKSFICVILIDAGGGGGVIRGNIGVFCGVVHFF